MNTFTEILCNSQTLRINPLSFISYWEIIQEILETLNIITVFHNSNYVIIVSSTLLHRLLERLIDDGDHILSFFNLSVIYLHCIHLHFYKDIHVNDK